MPNGDPRDGIFYPTLILMMDSYITLADEREDDNCLKLQEKD